MLLAAKGGGADYIIESGVLDTPLVGRCIKQMHYTPRLCMLHSGAKESVQQSHAESKTPGCEGLLGYFWSSSLILPGQ